MTKIRRGEVFMCPPLFYLRVGAHCTQIFGNPRPTIMAVPFYLERQNLAQ